MGPKKRSALNRRGSSSGPRKKKRSGVKEDHGKEMEGESDASFSLERRRSLGRRSLQIPRIRNKMRRQAMVGRLYYQRKAERRKLRDDIKRRRLQGDDIPKGETRTIEKLREPDETILPKDDPEQQEENAVDEFSLYFAGKVTPKLMIITAQGPTKVMVNFLKELVIILPNAFYYKRKDFSLRAISKFAYDHEFTDLLVFKERNKKVTGLYICHLPAGPTSYFRLTSLKLAQEMKGGACTTDHRPEIILKNFDTRLGDRVERQLRALFPLNPEYEGRHVICLHNQRDFIFFRHHRYMFDKHGECCRLMEIGPRFTMKLQWMQEGAFNTKTGRFEFIWRADLQVSRKAMFI